ncbi:hypothetical protein ABBQ38_007704 [Trebouxia sp. C0009 RCD-2024]
MHACQRGNAHGWMRLAVKQAILVPGQATPGLSYLWQNQHLPYTQTNKSSQYFEDEHVRESNLGGVIAVADMTKPPRHTRQTHDQDMVPWRCTRTHKSGPTRGAAAVYGDYSTAGQVFAAQGPVMVQITALQVFRQRKHWLCYIGLTAELLLSFGLAAVSPLSRQVKLRCPLGSCTCCRPVTRFLEHYCPTSGTAAAFGRTVRSCIRLQLSG